MNKYLMMVFALAIMAVSAVSFAASPAISAFNPVGLSGISLVPGSLSFGTQAYTLNMALSPNPKLYWSTYTYDITQIWGFYAIGHNFTASGANVENWKWDTNSGGGGYVAGWTNPSKNQAITPGNLKPFAFTMLAANQGTADITMGLHVSLDLGNQPSPFGSGNTGAVYNDGNDTPIEVVPEASTFVGFGSALVMAAPGLVGWIRRRKI